MLTRLLVRNFKRLAEQCGWVRYFEGSADCAVKRCCRFACEDVDAEIRDKLDAILEVARRARPLEAS